MAFQKGVSGNQSGKSKLDAEATMLLRRQCRIHAEKAIKALVKILDKPDNQQAQISAAKEILDRGFGKAQQGLTVSGDDDNPLTLVKRIELICLDDRTNKIT
jgi:hypothetical protein